MATTTEPADLNDPTKQHQVVEANPITENLPDGHVRVSTPVFDRAKNFVHGLIKAGVLELAWGKPAGPGDIQMHHSGSIPIFFAVTKTWRIFLAPHGSEYSGQFIIDPAKLDKIRLGVLDLVMGFPETLDEMDRLGYTDGRRILNTPIVDAQTTSDYVDSAWNSQAPIPAKFHTGVISAKNPDGAGEHHYAKPLADMQHLKWDDFQIWHLDPETKTPVAVSATHPRGSGISTVKVQYAQPGTPLAAAVTASHDAGVDHILPPDHPIAQAAFAHQT